ncbi:SigB/SigF/SigG family RNA polymerase sigma factor [Krasilnikovia sp. M28-CT-15]|uniref:SigB/SigF/SigG family RNA polymerase sigma factor n=1 Tax=Krasilnikovia sp. M28-CT-15 TaxID=3373540 RepID=UPI003876D056
MSQSTLVRPSPREEHRREIDDVETVTATLFSRLDDEACGAVNRSRLREQIIRLNLPIATRLARRYRDRGQPLEDLEQVAALALVKAVNGFDPTRGKPFLGYLVPTVLGELKRHFRDKGWDVRVSRRMQELHLELGRTRDVLLQQFGRAPTVPELAVALDVSDEEVRRAQAAGSAYDIDSLNTTVSSDEDSCERLDLIGVEDRSMSTLCDHLALRELLHRLPPRERFVIIRYFFGNASQAEIAEALGMSQMNVSRLLRRTLTWLRARLDGEPEQDGEPVCAQPEIRTYVARSGAVVLAVHGVVDGPGAQRLRDAVVDAAVRRRPGRIFVDMRHVDAAATETVRALVDGYRACGHSGSSLVVTNAAPPLHDLLHRLGVDRLFPCLAVADRPSTADATQCTGPGDHCPAPEPATGSAGVTGRPRIPASTRACGFWPGAVGRPAVRPVTGRRAAVGLARARHAAIRRPAGAGGPARPYALRAGRSCPLGRRARAP